MLGQNRQVESVMSQTLLGKVALVTGGGRGLGRAHALALARAGARVVVNDLGGSDRGEGADPDMAAAVAREIQEVGGNAIASNADVSDWDDAGRAVRLALDTFGRLDIIVNNAGISRFAPIGAMSREDWTLTIGVNLTGTAAVTHWAAAHWIEVGPESGRAIINTSSPAGTNPLPGSPAYCASKAGVAALTIASAAELAPLGVRVNAIAPMGRTRLTDAVPFVAELMKAPATGFDRAAPDCVSPVVVYLASPACRFTGRVFGIEGDDLFVFDGWSARHRFNNAGTAWDQATLAERLEAIDLQDLGWGIAPATHMVMPNPSDATLKTLATIAEER
jgi:NAD(P)-dependent dehydrogenase (short-subunit alcohol dehydrogenase family)